MTVPELQRAMSSYLRPEDDLEGEAQSLVRRGWLTSDETGRLEITTARKEVRLRLKRHAPAIRAAIHDGIADADYVTALKVLRRLIQNTGGPAQATSISRTAADSEIVEARDASDGAAGGGSRSVPVTGAGRGVRRGRAG